MSDIKITNYNRSKIYKIYCEDEGVDEFYIGSSANLKVRINNHKTDCHNINSEKYNRKLYTYIRANFGFENFIVKTLERFPCENELALRQREQKWINELKPTLNSNRSYKTYADKQEEWKRYELTRPNKQERLTKAKEHVKCDRCDRFCQKSSKARHQRTQYCINYKSNQNV